MTIEKLKKRDGRLVAFDKEKIAAAIAKAFEATYKAYILYRNERSRAREMNTRLMKVYEDITFSDAVDSDVKRENANINGDTAMGAMLKYGSEGAKQFYQMFVLKPEHARAHQEGDIHIHDLDFYTISTADRPLSTSTTAWPTA